MSDQCKYCGAEDECDCTSTITMWQYHEMKTKLRAELAVKERECEALHSQLSAWYEEYEDKLAFSREEYSKLQRMYEGACSMVKPVNDENIRVRAECADYKLGAECEAKAADEARAALTTSREQCEAFLRAWVRTESELTKVREEAAAYKAKSTVLFMTLAHTESEEK